MRRSADSRSAVKNDDQQLAMALDRNASLDRQIGINLEARLGMPGTTKKLAAAKLV